jgi:hypothetical protein
MAITDIPEFVEVGPGDLIRADDWNNIQRQIRNSVRAHRHSRPAGDPVDDTVATDNALQIAADDLADAAVTGAKIADGAIDTAKLADGAVTGAKLSSGAITADVIPNGAVTTDKIADNAVTAAKILDGAVGTAELGANVVTRANIAEGAVGATKLGFTQVATNSLQLAGNSTQEILVQSNAPNTKTTTFFPQLTLTGATGAGIANVDATVAFHQAAGANTIDVFIRIANRGTATVGVIWRVITFAT